MQNNHEQRDLRVLSGQNFEIRGKDSETRTVYGYAAVFDTETDIGGYFREKIARGAFVDAIGVSDIHALYNHDYGQVLGRAKSGTLRMSEDEKGLKVEIDLPDTQDGRDLAVKMERGDIDEMSFGFSMRDGEENWDFSGDEDVRTITKVGEMFDVSVCPRGAYPTTESGVRSRDHFKKEHNYNAAQRRLRMKINLGLMDRENGN